MARERTKIKLRESARILKIFIVGSFLLVSASIFVFSVLYVKKFRSSFERLLAITDTGEVFSPKMIKLENQFSLEAINHIKTFLEYFFSYDQNNYLRRIKKTLLLGDASVKLAYEKRKNKEYIYSSTVENSILSKILFSAIANEIMLEYKKDHTWGFFIETQLQIDTSGKKDLFLLKAKGTLQKTKRQIRVNPHGLLICDFSYEIIPFEK